MELTPTNNNNNDEIPTMTSLQLVKFINEDRRLVAEETGGKYVELEHSDFLKKVPKVLGENRCGKFFLHRKDSQNKDRPMYILPEREATLMAMSYSYSLQAKVYDEFQRIKKVGLSFESKIIEIVVNIQNQITQLQKQFNETNSSYIALMNTLAIQQTPSQQPAEDPSKYFRVVEYGERYFGHIPNDIVRADAKSLGQMVASISHKWGLPIKQEKNLKFGSVTRKYHVDALKEAYAKFYN